MKNRKLYLVFVLILSIGLIFAGCSNNSSSPGLDDNDNTYSISGKITDDSGNPIEDVTLKFSNDNEIVTTNNEGKWQKTGLTGEVEVTPVKEGYEFSPTSKTVSGSKDDVNFTVKNSIIIPSTTKIIDDETSKKIEQVTDTKVVISKDSNLAQSINQNDIIVSGVTDKTPYGMLRKVESKTTEGGNIVLQTSMASLNQAIKAGTISKEIVLTQEDVKTNNILTSGIKVAPSAISKEFNYQLDKVIYDKDGNKDTEYDQVVSTGNVSFGYKIDLGMRIESFELQSFVIASEVEGNQELSITSGVSYSKEQTFEMARVKFSPITIIIPTPVGPFPIVITPNLVLELGYSGSISAEVSLTTSLNEKITGGLYYESGNWQPINELDINYNSPNIGLETGANFMGFAGPELSTMVYELAGPSSQISSYLELQADPQKEIWWKLYGGISGNFGAEVEAFGRNIANYEKQVIDYRKVIAEANVAPVITSISDKTVTEGENLEFKVSASDPNNDELTYSATGDLTSYFDNKTQTFSWTPGNGEAGSYSTTFEVSDGEKSDTESVNITVNESTGNSSPTIDRIGRSTWGLQATISASVSDIDNNLTDVTIDWGDGNSTNVSSGFDNISESHTYASVGTYTVNVTATDSEGATASESLTVSVSESNEAPTIDVSASTNNLTATISGSITDSDGSVSSAEIAWGDGKTTNITSGFDNIGESYTYNSEGKYTLNIAATDNDGKTSTKDIIIEVINSSNSGNLKWSLQIGSGVSSGPAIAEDGTIYVGSEDHKLYAIKPDGTKKWSIVTGDVIVFNPAIAEDGTIYVGSADENLYAINPDGTEKWRFQIGSEVTSSPAIADDGTIYIDSDDGYLYAINPDGTKKWRSETRIFINSSPAIADDGTIYASNDYDLYAINPDGTEKWSFYNNEMSSNPAIADDGTIYVGSDDKNLYAINPDGTEKWSFETNGVINSSPVIASDGTVYVGSNDRNLYAINPDGTKKWSFETGNYIESSASIADDGTIYIGSGGGNLYDYDCNLYAINPDGTKKWSFQIDYYIYPSPAIADDGTIYIGSNDGYLYAIEGSSTGLANTPWPKFGNNNRNTGKEEF